MRSVSVAFNVYVTNRVGAEGMGILSLVGSAYGFAVTFATSGISLSVTRLCAETVMADGVSRPRKKLSNVISVSAFYALLLGGIAGAALYFGADFIGGSLLSDERCIPSLRVYAATLPLTAILSVTSGYFSACRRVSKNAATQILGQGVRIFITVAALFILTPEEYGLEGSLIAVSLGGAVSETVSFVVSALLYIIDRNRHFQRDKKDCVPPSVKKYHGTELSADTRTKTAKSLVSSASPVMAAASVRSGLVTLEHILIPKGLLKSGASYSAALASYGTLHGCVMPVILFPYAVLGSFTSLIIPELSLSRANGQNGRIRHIGRLVFRSTLIFAVGVSGIMMLFSRELGLLLYDSREAGDFIRILAPVIPVMYLDTAVDSMLKGLGQQLYCMKVNIFDAALSAFLVWVLVPVFGVSGYAAVIIIAEVVNASLSIWKLLSVTGIEPNIVGWLIKPLSASVLSCTAIKFLLGNIRRLYGIETPLGVTFLIIASAALYIAVLTVTNTLTKDDISYISGIFGKERPLPRHREPRSLQKSGRIAKE